MEIYLLVAAIYFVMSFIAARLVALVEWWLTPAYLRTPSLLRKAVAQEGNIR